MNVATARTGGWVVWVALCSSNACGSAGHVAPSAVSASTPSAITPITTPNELPDLPLRGALDAELTLLSILDFGEVEGRAMFAALDQVQNRLGHARVRWVLYSRAQLDLPEDTVLQAVQERTGGAGSFAYLQALSERAATGHVLDLGERLQIGLQVQSRLASPSRVVRKHSLIQDVDRVKDQYELEIEGEMAALAQRAPSRCLLSINGVHVRGLPRMTQLEQLVAKELELATALRTRGHSARELFQQRVNANRDTFIDLGPEPAPPKRQNDAAPDVEEPHVDPDALDTADSNHPVWNAL